MDFAGTGFAQHPDDGALGGPAHDGVVDDHDPLPVDVLPQRVELAPDAQFARPLAGRDEGPADVPVLHQSLTVGYAGGAGEAFGGGHTRLGDTHDEIGLHRCLGRQPLPHAPARGVDLTPVEPAVGAGEVDELEDAEMGVDPVGIDDLLRPQASLVQRDQLARLDLTDERGAHDVEGGCLRRQRPALGLVGRAQSAETERAESVGVTDTHDVGGVEEDEGEGALEKGEHGPQRRLQRSVGYDAAFGRCGKFAGQEIGHEIAVGGHHTGEHAGLLGQSGRVGQVPVVAEGETRSPHRAVDGLGVAPLRRPRRRIPGVAHGQITGKTGDGAFVEDGGDETHVLHHGDGFAVAHGHPGRFLPAMLQRVHSVEGQLGDPLAGGIDAEDAAGLFHAGLSTSVEPTRRRR